MVLGKETMGVYEWEALLPSRQSFGNPMADRKPRVDCDRVRQVRKLISKLEDDQERQMDIGHHRQEARVQFFASGARGVAIVGPNHRLIASGLDF